ncbi:very long-chain acyl-CoA synthetase-like [Anneissia japonica]|uniref:very long-chain acyl-CoA synthetase-like n=1 Tax=Anneissia japonica TaxID=1529436 RepID=UPI00142580DC|nr:very long-chain acyl-CoA synthetase-like [Anneissia japonica]
MLDLIIEIAIVCAIMSVVAIQLAYPRLWTDVSFIADKVKTTRRLKQFASQKIPRTIVDVFEDHARNTPDKVFIVYQNQNYTYSDVNKKANRVARLAQKMGFKIGDVVALLLSNEPAFIWNLLGFAKLGVRCALLNYNLKAKSLLHCFRVGQARALIVGQGDQLQELTKQILPDLIQSGTSIWLQGSLDCTLPPMNDSIMQVDPLLENVSDVDLPRDVRQGLNFRDPIVYIYTSGTTGLPKATKLSHYKLLAGGNLLNFFNFSTNDVIYVTLPLYHISAIFFGLSNTLNKGATMVLRSKFSASTFWDDCRRHNVTIVLYVGELFRYLLARPKEPNDSQNKVRLALGNGLGADIWQEAKERYGIDQIVETYGATESNFGIMNIENKPGSVGCWPPLLRTFCPIELIKYDYETAQPVRDEKGRCIRVSPGEVGLLVCPVNKMFPVEGYVGNKEQTEKKLIRNVLRKDDIYFNTGDLFIINRDHFLYFKDRLGDTFRWKGENVATTEVAQVINEYEGVLEANVYGVCVTGCCGKAGMAAIIMKSQCVINPEKLFHHVTKSLPNYACPRFIRLVTSMEHTCTFKQKKTQLVQEGFDPELVSDPLYFMDDVQQKYVTLDPALYLKITNGGLRL